MMATQALSWRQFICIGQCTFVLFGKIVSVQREALYVWNGWAIQFGYNVMEQCTVCATVCICACMNWLSCNNAIWSSALWNEYKWKKKRKHKYNQPFRELAPDKYFTTFAFHCTCVIKQARRYYGGREISYFSRQGGQLFCRFMPELSLMLRISSEPYCKRSPS